MPQSKKPRAVKPIAIAGIALLVLIAGSYGLHEWQQARAEAHRKQVAADLVANAARTKDYASVRNAFRAGMVDAETLNDAIRTEFEKQALDRTNRYFMITDPIEKSAYLDRVIDEMEAFRSESKKTADSTTKPSTRPAGNWEADMVRWALSQPPDQRAKLAEFHVAMERRRSERGLPSIFTAPGIMKTAFSGGGKQS